ncbi:MAG TPA: site-specific DNA-methyltransferase [Candidatus Binataceae bacterium]|nr:site-specific DNA-methyltransferase [Candidatus Binataceae bacterium]
MAIKRAAGNPRAGKIQIGDTLQIMPALAAGSVDCCITDPPYNMSRKKGLGWAFSSHVTMQESWDRFSNDEYYQFTFRWLTEVCRAVRPNGNILVFGSFHNIYLIGFILQFVLQRRLLQQLTWFKPNAQPNITGRLLTESTEFVIWACNNSPADAKKWVFNYDEAKSIGLGKQLRNMWQIPYTPASEKLHGGHPSQKPLELLSRMIRIWTNPGDVVLDCFLGTGTTAVACAQLGRRWIGIEKDAAYAEIARKRLHI